MKSINTSQAIVGFWDSRQGGRPENQDSCGFIDTARGHLAIICDGMGGGPAGKLASSLAVQRIMAYVNNAPEDEKSSEMLRHAIEHAHQAILEEAAKKPELKGMGTTAAVLLIGKRTATVAHVGDSRVYQFRNGSKVFRTEDHSWVAEMVRNKSLTEEQARLSSQSNIITRALGGKSEELADVQVLSYEAGDRFMLCTDGIWGMLSEKELIQIAAKTPSLAGAVDSLVVQVDELGRNSGNTHDNLTIAILETKENSTKKGSMRKKDRLLLRLLLACCAVLFLAALYYRMKASNNVMNDSQQLALDSLRSQINSIRSQNEKLGDSIRRLNDSVGVYKEKYQELQDRNKKAQELLSSGETEGTAQESQEDKKPKESVSVNKEVEDLIKDVIKILEKVDVSNLNMSNIDKAKSKLRQIQEKDHVNANIDVYRKSISTLNKLPNMDPHKAEEQLRSIKKKLETIKTN